MLLLLISFFGAFSLVKALLIVGLVFLVLIVIGLVKSFKLKAENERLSQAAKENEEKNKYQDFTEGHLYENNDN